jgi:hypothetical protein
MRQTTNALSFRSVFPVDGAGPWKLRIWGSGVRIASGAPNKPIISKNYAVAAKAVPRLANLCQRHVSIR